VNRHSPRHDVVTVLGVLLLLSAILSYLGPAASALPTSTRLAANTAAPVSVSIFVAPTANVKNMGTNWFTLYVEKLFNMKITWVEATSADAATKESLLFASGDYPDAFFGQSLTTTELLKYGQQGVIINLAPYIREYAPNTWTGLQTTPAAKDAAGPPNGPMYDVPSYNYCQQCSYPAKMWIDVKYLKQFGLSMPTTTSQFLDVLEAFKAHGLVPLTGEGLQAGGWNTDLIEFLMDPFIYDAGDTNSGYFVIKDGNLEYAPADEGWRQGLEYIHTLYQKGLIDSTALVQGASSFSAQLATGKVGAFPDGGAFTVVPDWGAPSSDYPYWMAVPPLKGPDGTQYATFAGNGAQADPSLLITNKATPAQIKVLMALTNFLWTPNGTQLMDYGPKGEYWQPAPKGQLDEVGTQSVYDQPSGQFFAAGSLQNAGWTQNGPYDQSEAWRNVGVQPLSPFIPAGVSGLDFYTQAFYQGHQPALVAPYSIWVVPNDAETYATVSTNIINYVQESADQFILGTKSLSASSWASYVSGLNSLGLKQYLSITKQSMGSPLNTSSFTPNITEVNLYLSGVNKTTDAYQLGLLHQTLKLEGR
jgi:putative aldouronate transport system substrate-binding protein